MQKHGRETFALDTMFIVENTFFQNQRIVFTDRFEIIPGHPLEKHYNVIITKVP